MYRSAGRCSTAVDIKIRSQNKCYLRALKEEPANEDCSEKGLSEMQCSIVRFFCKKRLWFVVYRRRFYLCAVGAMKKTCAQLWLADFMMSNERGYMRGGTCLPWV